MQDERHGIDEAIDVKLNGNDVNVIIEALETLITSYNSGFFTQDMETTNRISKTLDLAKKNLYEFKNISVYWL